MNEFEKLGIIPGILKAIEVAGYQTPTPIQAEAIPLIFANKDVLGTAQTGTGKTAAFAIPLLQNVYSARKYDKEKLTRVLVLTPTRELANQVFESFKEYSQFLNIKNLCVFGGVSKRPQSANLIKGTDVLVATPGRLLDLMTDGVVNLTNVKYFVLDEADQMLDMGFINDVKKIIAKMPRERQTMLFSATMPKEVLDLANSILNEPVRIAITPVATTLDTIKDKVYFVSQRQKANLLVNLIQNTGYNQVLVFVRTKRNVDKVAKELLANNIKADAIHSNKSQAARTRALGDFKSGSIEVLVATDIAARGLDIAALPYVYNFDLPEMPETYIHRIGRTGRAGLEGIAISFCDNGERHLLRDIEKHIGRKIEVIAGHPFESKNVETNAEHDEYNIAKVNRNRKERVIKENTKPLPSKHLKSRDNERRHDRQERRKTERTNDPFIKDGSRPYIKNNYGISSEINTSNQSIIEDDSVNKKKNFSRNNIFGRRTSDAVKRNSRPHSKSGSQSSESSRSGSDFSGTDSNSKFLKTEKPSRYGRHSNSGRSRSEGNTGNINNRRQNRQVPHSGKSSNRGGKK